MQMEMRESGCFMEQLESGTRETKACVVWQDLTVVALNPRNGVARKLLKGLCGYAEPHRMMAVMGPSGSGKSTLLDALAGRVSANIVTSGDVLLTGKKTSIDCRCISYVTQDDVYLGTLTVRETLSYSAHLRLPMKMTKNEIRDVVQRTIIKLGLQDCADNIIGDWHLRGISSGEKRRLSISLEILTQPCVLLVDEATSGLDSASAFFVLQALSNIAHEGKIVVCSVHQPSSHLFDLFDDLLLLSGGEEIYFGDAKMAVKFFADAGFPCPTRRNPSDHFLLCTNSDFDNIPAGLMQLQGQSASANGMLSNSHKNFTTKEIKAALVKAYKCSEYSMNAGKRIREITLSQEGLVSSPSRSNTSWWKQLCILSHRSFQNMCRDIGYYRMRILFYILVSITAGSIYFNVGLSHSDSAIIARARCNGFVYGFMTIMSVGGMPFFIEELKVSNRERLNSHYGDAVFVISNFLSSLPFLMLSAVSSGTIIYYMVKFHPGFSHYSYFCINLFCCISIMECWSMIVALVVPNALTGVGTGAALCMIMMMASGIFRLIPDLPSFFWRYPMSYITFASWAIQGQYKNDMIGLEFDPVVPGKEKLKGETILQTIFKVQLHHSKWCDLAALVCLFFSSKLVLFILLKYKGKASTVFCRLYAKKAFQQIGK